MMKVIRRFSLLLLALLSALSSAATTPRGFEPLFNGRDLRGWRGGTALDPRELQAMPAAEKYELLAQWTRELVGSGQPHWRVESGELINDGRGTYLTTEKEYRDFVLQLDYRLTPGAESGICLRGVPNVQIGDPQQPGRGKGSGGLSSNPAGSPGREPRIVADRPAGTWNQMRILMVGSRVSVWLNEQPVVEHAILENPFDQKLSEAQRRPVPVIGPIQLQTHSGEIRWRNLAIREIGSEEACRILAEVGRDRFTPIFNGRDFTGWSGALEAATVRDGVLSWGKGKGGVLYWDEWLTDFKVRLMFRLESASNNGLAIRYPGTGRPAYDAMCELQILAEDFDWVKKEIDPRQAHGSVYGKVAAMRGYQQPIGEWNFQEVTVKGSRITVELNGTCILDADVDKVDLSTAMGKTPYTGSRRREGYLGFAGHRDVAEFRDLLLQKLSLEEKH